MSEFKGNQGILTVQEIKDDLYINIVNEKGNSVAGISTREEFYKEFLYYGLIFSKAPELLESVKGLLLELEFHGFINSTEINKAKQLIKQATEL